MNSRNIILISLGLFENGFLRKIAEAVNSEYGLPVIIKEGHLDITEYYDPVRRQYNGMKLLKEIESSYASNGIKTIGLFSVDLFIPIMTYIFGQAFLNGQTAIASLYRLSNERYGMKSDDKLILDRFKKEVIHELGHTFGLIHCHVQTCVMKSSTYVEDIDQKSQKLCLKCQNEIKR